MFEGRRFAQGGGYKGWAIRFVDCKTKTGAATTAYSFGLNDEERTELARRIAAALNFTTNIPTAQLEAAQPLQLKP
ncbi:hypothetical protein [Comamonas testosteroni]|jgi:hypothetical protein|uniref:hypothetical protein n=1 Tax=Comamonas testosteroni TaxID=285 RepID=UPI0026F346DA|nr:hypothetical protein [Comamonas testosteroni]